MIRVAFPNFTRTGKLNYYRNLIEAIKAVPMGEIEPVILLGTRSEWDFPNDFPRVRVVRSRFLDEDSLFFAVRKAVVERYGFDLVLEWVCRVNKIRLLSHFGFLRPRSKVKTIGWIYDFQHKHLPDYFSEEELRHRDRQFADVCKFCDRVVVSSEDARKDLARFLC